MSINKVLNGSMADPNRQLAATFKQFKRNIRELKTPQHVGGDILGVQSLPTITTVLVSSLTLGPTYGWNLSAPFAPLNSTLTLWNFLPSLFVDATINPITGIPDIAHHYPGGSALTSNQVQLKWEPWTDWATSSDSTNMRNFIMRVVNNDTAPHVYTIAIKAYFPALGQTG